MRQFLLGTMLLLGVTTLAACGDDDTTPMADAPVGGGVDAAPMPDGTASSVVVGACTGLTPAATVATSGFAFSPADVTINAGEVVRFAPAGAHNMTSGTPAAQDGLFATPTNMERCLTFNDPGAFPFFCSVHPSMLGSVTVN